MVRVRVAQFLLVSLVVLAALLFGLAAASGDRAQVGPLAETRVAIVGSPQVVFDWSREACVSGGYPDQPARAFRDFRGHIQLLLSHYVNYRLIGPSIDDLRPDCNPVMSSAEDPRPSSFADRGWIASVFTRDGRNIWALVHDEYQGNRHPGRCPSGSYYRCWYNAVTLARSTDGGRTYQPARRGSRALVAAPSFRYRPDLGARGVFAPSNVVRGQDGAYYALVRVRDLTGREGVCAMRTARISSPAAWRAWDGEGFDLRFHDPYRSPDRPRLPCELIQPEAVATMTESLTYSRPLHRYLLVGLALPGPSSVGSKVRGFYYSTSTDLVHWAPRTLIAPAVTNHSHRCGGPPAIAYPSVIDPTSDSRTFAISGKRPFLYYTLLHYAHCHLTTDRDLMRVRLQVAR